MCIRDRVQVARKFVDMGFKLVATAGTADAIESAGMSVERVYKVKEGRPNAVSYTHLDVYKRQPYNRLFGQRTKVSLKVWVEGNSRELRVPGTARNPNPGRLLGARDSVLGTQH